MCFNGFKAAGENCRLCHKTLSCRDGGYKNKPNQKQDMFCIITSVPKTMMTVAAAGLLTCPSLRTAFPSLQTVTLNCRRHWQDLQQWVCPGLSPDSLFTGLLRHRYGRKISDSILNLPTKTYLPAGFLTIKSYRKIFRQPPIPRFSPHVSAQNNTPLSSPHL